MSDAAASHPVASRGCFTPLPSQKCLREVVTRGKLRLESLSVKHYFRRIFFAGSLWQDSVRHFFDLTNQSMTGSRADAATGSCASTKS
jgi:hypothetical protein